ncbi:extracellular solute-binding protein [Liquorilactobacillus vini]|uniref:Uncharacterized protein n=1 Tax=Liquorilactobacillus vini DSM 20605 TaxID=1133569 RepID=A0A0R2BUF7_9LACO|nr:extracellular solute-binding protein [Liquorilactobacillus vini]KRM82290.1 hypothetical protein FD21_GL000435 [Liquorilactobacillus vini DSM 20605]
MNLKRLSLFALSFASIGLLLGGCSSSPSSSSSSSKTKITFWAAPNPPQLKFWKQMATKFEKQNPNITVKVSQMKESPTSEAAIQSAIASGTQPTISENITRSFATQLSKSGAIVSFNKNSILKKYTT